MNEFEIYDRAVVDFFKVTIPGDIDPVPIVFTTGHRAFQRIEYLYAKTSKKLTYPLMAVSRLDVVPAFDRFRFNNRVKVAPNGTNTAYRISDRFPGAVDISYSVEIRSTTMESLNEIRSLIYQRFTLDTAYILATVSPWGEKRYSIRIDGYSDSSDIETGEDEVKFRDTISATFRGYVFPAATSIKDVKRINPNAPNGGIFVKVYDDTKTPEEFLEQVPVGKDP